MKVRKIESLKKNVLLVHGLPDGKLDMDFLHKVLFPKGDWKLLGKLKDLTGDDVRGLVQKMRFSFSDRYLDYKPYFYSPNHFATPKESFLSALEAEGVLFENPHKKSHFNPEEFIQEEYERFMEAEQNVFSENTLVFVEL